MPEPTFSGTWVLCYHYPMITTTIVLSIPVANVAVIRAEMRKLVLSDTLSEEMEQFLFEVNQALKVK